MPDIFFEIIIKDESFKRIGTWKFHKKDAAKFFKILNEQLGLGLKISKKEILDLDKDLDWAK